MSESEILDIVDENGNILGQAPRYEFHKNPNIIHGVVHCWIFNKKGQILWQQRSLKKATSPGKSENLKNSSLLKCLEYYKEYL